MIRAAGAVRSGLFALALAGCLGPAAAQGPAPAPAGPAPSAPAPAPDSSGAAAQAQPPAPPTDVINRANTELVVILVRTTLVAVHQANLTGNYTVLHEIGAPDFQHRNNAADLSAVFSQLRALKLDLSRAVILDPQITRAQLTADRKLYVVGALASEPVPITFEMLFQPVDSVWRVYGVSITPVGALSENAGMPRPALVRGEKPVAAATARPKPKPAAPARPQAKAATTPGAQAPGE